MIVAELNEKELAGRLAGPGLRLRTGPVVTLIRSRLREVVDGIALHYAAHRAEDESGFADFHVAVSRPASMRRWVKPQVVFQFDAAPPFHPLPAEQAFPILEWGLNWCVAAHCHQYLVFHAAVLAQGARALLLPGAPGSGKSTLCAGLAGHGWRLLSDELALLAPVTGDIAGLARPISLKNASIAAIRSFLPAAELGPTVADTLKGSVAHLKPPAESVRRAADAARARWIVFPRYQAGAPAELSPLRKASAFMRLADGAFNYHVHGRRGFEVVAELVESCDCLELVYGDLAQAIPVFADLASRP